MTSKPSIWYRITIALSVLNVAGAGFALGSAELMHASVHVAVALAFGSWAFTLRQGPAVIESQTRLEKLETEIGKLQQELTDTQERLDFVERLIAQGQETRRVGPQP